jgi:ferredoxin-NADP reductase
MAWFTLRLTNRHWLTGTTFELTFDRPTGFTYIAGQRIRLALGNVERDYSLISTPGDKELSICVRHIPNGTLTPALANLDDGRDVNAAGPFGYFTWYASSRPAVCVATGTGIAPFLAFVRSGVRPWLLLHGVRSAEELFYRDELAFGVDRYLPCLSSANPPADLDDHVFAGRVTTYLTHNLHARSYDFYLCGRGDMIREVTHLVDRSFPGSKIYSERFY